MRDNKWEEIWNRRVADIENNVGDEKALFLELKRSNGFDVVEEGLAYEDLIMQYQQIRDMLFKDGNAS